MPLALLLGLWLLGCEVVHATTYWVSTTGNDANPCGAASGTSDPGVYKLTVSAGVGCMVGGDTLKIKGGTYTGANANLRALPSGTIGNPTIVEGDPSSTVGCAIAHTCLTILHPTGSGGTTNNAIIANHYILRKIDFDHRGISGNSYPLHVNGPCTDVLIEDVETHGTIQAVSGGASGVMVDEECTFVTFRRLNSHDNGEIHADGTVRDHGIYLQGDDVTVEDSWIHDNASFGVQCYRSASLPDPIPDRCVFRNNLFEGNNSNFALEGNDAMIYNNVFRNPRSGVNLSLGFGGSQRTLVYNNLVYTASGGSIGIIIGNFNGGANSIFRNNIIFGHSSELIINASATGVIAEYNACPSGKFCGTTGKLSIAAITDILVSTTDYQLKAGSSAINAGTASLTDRLCNSTCDIGPMEAFDFSSGIITGNMAEITLGMNTNTPVSPSASGWSIACTPSPTACPMPTITTVTLKTGASSVVSIAYSGGSCSTGQTWTVSYDPSAGLTTDSIPLAIHQELSPITTQGLTNGCGGITNPWTGTIAAVGFRLYAAKTDYAGAAIPLAPLNTNIIVPARGAFAIAWQTDGLGSDPSPIAEQLYYSCVACPSIGASTAVPITSLSDGVEMWGMDREEGLLSGSHGGNLSGALTHIDGGTTRIAASVPVFDLTLNSSIVMRWIVRIVAGTPQGRVFCFTPKEQSGIDLDSVTPPGGACVTVGPPLADGGP